MLLDRLFDTFILLAWTAMISLPGIGVAYIGWKLTSKLQPVSVRILLRAAIIAFATTPSIWGHGDILPAIFLAVALQGSDLLVGIIPILVVFAIAIPVLALHAGKTKASPPVEP